MSRVAIERLPTLDLPFAIFFTIISPSLKVSKKLPVEYSAE
ncbi:MAG TPA: hypothetical protein VHZ76_00935 [Gammaproteobacteria bacterium]|nr:hypothetical protein [Gammaproteobacteria bacterium]